MRSLRPFARAPLAALLCFTLLHLPAPPRLVPATARAAGSTFYAANTDSDYNVLGRVSTDDGSGVLTLAQWQARGHDPHSLSADPAALFVNEAARDYRLKPASPAVDRGETLAGVTTDLDGRPRPRGASSDVGCYELAPAGGNPIDEARFFVRQHYLDFLGREPDAAGLDFWTGQITSCGAATACVEARRVNVSAAFFLSIEFQETGYLVYRMYKVAFGDLPGAPVPLRREEFLPDAAAVSGGVQVGVGEWQRQLEQNRRQFAAAFVARPRFDAAHPATQTPEQFVASLDANAGGVLSAPERAQLVSDLSSGVRNRAEVLRAVVEDADAARLEFNKAFVLMQYFGYLRRDPNDPPDTNYDGHLFWLAKLNQFGGDFVRAEMVRAFIVSIEYRRRFGE